MVGILFIIVGLACCALGLSVLIRTVSERNDYMFGDLHSQIVGWACGFGICAISGICIGMGLAELFRK